MNQIARTFILVGLIVAILLALHFLPKLSVGQTELRRVNILSDILPEVHEDDLDAIPVVPDVPKPVLAQAAPVRDTADVSRQQPAATDRALPPMPMPDSTAGSVELPTAPVATVDSAAQGTAPILDYSQGRPGGMYHFYQALSQAGQLGRPVRVAYYGDSFIEGDIFTADLRELLQDRFGGNGVGWMDCASQVHGFRTTVQHNFSGVHEYEVVKRPFSTANQGIAQRYFTASEGARVTYKGAKVSSKLII